MPESQPPPFQLNLPRRPRRMRRTPALRALTTETRLHPADLVQPLFVIDGGGEPESIAALPGQCRWPIARLVEECAELAGLGIRAVALFPRLDPALKSPGADEALNPETLVLRAVRAVKEAVPALALITDIALDPYTDHGHDGLLTADGTDVANDATVEVLCKMAQLHAEAGVDLVAPSDMMDGRVGAVREMLDEAGHTQTGILAYSAKFASAFYGPFREAVGSNQAAGTKPLSKDTYQLNPANRREALAEALLDEAECADMLMVKPALPCLDILRDIREVTGLPLAAYQVSGEYAALHAAAERGWLDLARCREESLTGIKRAGAGTILTYFAKDAARELRGSP